MFNFKYYQLEIKTGYFPVIRRHLNINITYFYLLTIISKYELGQFYANAKFLVLDISFFL